MLLFLILIMSCSSKDLKNRATGNSVPDPNVLDVDSYLYKRERLGILFKNSCSKVTNPEVDSFVEEKDLKEAIKNGDLGKIKEAFIEFNDKYKNVKDLVNWTDDKGTRLLNIAAVELNKDIVEFLLKKGADINHLSIDTVYGGTALIGASSTTVDSWSFKRVDVVSLLLKEGADLNLGAELGYSPIAGAIIRGDVDLVQLLVDNGVNLGKYNRDLFTPLVEAMLLDAKEVPNKMNILEILVEKIGADNVSLKIGEDQFLTINNHQHMIDLMELNVKIDVFDDVFIENPQKLINDLIFLESDDITEDHLKILTLLVERIGPNSFELKENNLKIKSGWVIFELSRLGVKMEKFEKVCVSEAEEIINFIKEDHKNRLNPEDEFLRVGKNKDEIVKDLKSRDINKMSVFDLINVTEGNGIGRKYFKEKGETDLFERLEQKIGPVFAKLNFKK